MEAVKEKIVPQTSENEVKGNLNKEMNTIRLPKTDWPRIVVIGGGFAGLSFVKKLKNKKVQVVVIDKNNFHQFQFLLY